MKKFKVFYIRSYKNNLFKFIQIVFLFETWSRNSEKNMKNKIVQKIRFPNFLNINVFKMTISCHII